MDVKDAFLMVPQPRPVKIKVNGEDYIVERNLPGQRLGARLWHLHLRKFMETQLNCTFCVEQPCLAKCDGGIFLIHVDDLMFVGDSVVWKEKILKKFPEQFTINFEQIGETGSAVSFLKRKIVKLDRGLALVSGKSAQKGSGSL